MLYEVITDFDARNIFVVVHRLILVGRVASVVLTTTTPVVAILEVEFDEIARNLGFWLVLFRNNFV